MVNWFQAASWFFLFWVNSFFFFFFWPNLYPRLTLSVGFALMVLKYTSRCYLQKFNLFILKKRRKKESVPLMDSSKVELCCSSILFCVVGVELNVQSEI
ncbi:hypothetical protein D8674_008967 [Pyrus ussuriensis x Pyrus communis]|uniref:Uncharacterized protein n=1 Tax=Pyrus ussuriensis x Pyrus communis TaxID=2448454 RepID=A0A5N5HV89_9ROSA|nr:hypothetical protein D8674_008967 [Pyrus ussuriensis x Pyrus communis]